MIQKLTCKLRRTQSSGIFHDSREDVRSLMQVCNILIDKVNELAGEVNTLKKERSEHERLKQI